MGEFEGKRVVLFHAGALGDFILIWPLLRALSAATSEITLVAPASHAALARSALLIAAISCERAWVSGLWRTNDGTTDSLRPPNLSAEIIISFVTDDRTEAGSLWQRNAIEMLIACTMIVVGPPGSDTRDEMWRRAEVERLGHVKARPRCSGPVLLHIGAGSRAKMWPMPSWASLADELHSVGQRPLLIAGPVERDRLRPDDRQSFQRLGGQFVETLDDLAAMTRDGCVFVGADTGPTHLAAQLGVPTVALFGPTDPAIWSPVGPCVQVVQASDGQMNTILPRDVARIVGELLAESSS